MPSIRERIETVFAALAFAEQNLDQEARDILNQTEDQKSAKANTAKRADPRPRLRA